MELDRLKQRYKGKTSLAKKIEREREQGGRQLTEVVLEGEEIGSNRTDDHEEREQGQFPYYRSVCTIERDQFSTGRQDKEEKELTRGSHCFPEEGKSRQTKELSRRSRSRTRSQRSHSEEC